MAECVPLRWIKTSACTMRWGRTESLTGNRNGDNDEQVDVEESGTRMISGSESNGQIAQLTGSHPNWMRKSTAR